MMRRVLAMLVVLAGISVLAPSPHASAETLQDLFASGVSAFREGRFEEAARVFEQMHGRYEVWSPDLLVNLGAAQFRAGMSGKAIVYLHRAIRVAPDSAAAELAAVNLDRIRASLNQNEDGGGQNFVFGAYHDVWTALFGEWSATPVLLAFIGSWALLFTALGLWRLSRGSSWRGRMAAAAIVLTVLTILAGIAAYGTGRVADYRIAVVTATQAGLYDSVTDLEPAMILPEAVEARVIETRGNFVRVRLASGREGYIQDKVIGIP